MWVFGFWVWFEVWVGVGWVWCFVCDLFVIVGLVLFGFVDFGVGDCCVCFVFCGLFGGFGWVLGVVLGLFMGVFVVLLFVLVWWFLFWFDFDGGLFG